MDSKGLVRDVHAEVRDQRRERRLHGLRVLSAAHKQNPSKLSEQVRLGFGQGFDAIMLQVGLLQKGLFLVGIPIIKRGGGYC